MNAALRELHTRRSRRLYGRPLPLSNRIRPEADGLRSFDLLRASPRAGCLVDPWWTPEGSIRPVARSPFPVCARDSGASMTARQSGLRLDIFLRTRETAFRSGTGIAPGGFEPPTSRL